MFGWVGIAHAIPNPINWSGSISIEANGLVPGRQRNSIGMGYFYTGLSSDFKDLLSVIPHHLRLAMSKALRLTISAASQNGST